MLIIAKHVGWHEAMALKELAKALPLHLVRLLLCHEIANILTRLLD